MSTFNLPDLGEGLQDAEIVNWLVEEGDTLTIDQPMIEMETAKAVVEVPSPFAGVLSKKYGKAGDVILVGAPLADFIVEGETAPVATVSEANASSGGSSEETAASSQANTAAVVTSGGEDFLLPDLGEGLQDAEIVNWLVKEGDTVTIDQPMVEMETAKAVVEVPSPIAGVITTLHGQAGEVILVGAPLVTFGGSQSAPAPAAEEKADDKPADAGTVVGAVEVGNTVVVETTNAVVKALARKLKVDLANVKGTGANGAVTQSDVKSAAKNGTSATKTSSATAPVAGKATDNPLAYKASPAVRAMARRLNVSLAACNATGKKGSITRADVEAASKGAPQSTAAPVRQAAPTAKPAASTSSGSRLPNIQVTVQPESVRGARRAMATAMAHSHATCVPTTLMDDANISGWKKGQDATVRLVRAIVSGCKAVPALNGWFDGENMERLLHPEVHVGMAVDTPDGLYVPTLMHCDTQSPAQMREQLNGLIEKIKTKRISPAEMSGGTITLSNFGTIAGRYGTPVISPPQMAILGAGRYREEAKLTEKGFEMQRMLPLSLTFDHRAATGGEAARFLKAAIEDLQLSI
jgi:2-oxoisovalerate dehydrogenase E2 component (dihydrolipoyl transacylase)